MALGFRLAEARPGGTDRPQTKQRLGTPTDTGAVSQLCYAFAEPPEITAVSRIRGTRRTRKDTSGHEDRRD